jgi:hypothetical protein
VPEHEPEEEEEEENDDDDDGTALLARRVRRIGERCNASLELPSESSA